MNKEKTGWRGKKPTFLNFFMIGLKWLNKT